ncbi:MAG: TIGR02302 family protein [Pararhodobacter sp.]
MASTDPLAPVSRALALTRAAMVVERAAQALWLPVSLAMLGGVAWAFGLHARLPGDAALWVTGALVVAILGTLGMGLWRFRWPTRAEAVARLDRTLPGRPLAALLDAQAINTADAASRGLWAAHVARMTERARAARPVPPAPHLARRDPYALRLVALTGVAVALLFAAPAQNGALGVYPGAAGAASGPSWEGWITPPAYTGRPGLYLNEIERDAFEVPQGSRVILRFYGPPGALTLEQSLDLGVQGDETGQALEFDARRSGRLAILGPNGREWRVTVAPDAVPTITGGPVSRGRGGVLELPFDVTDDNGATLGEAVITLDLAALDRRFGLIPDPEPRDPLVLALPMPMSGPRTAFSETLREDLSLHPWANLPVRIRLSATDAAGQTGESPEITAILPGRRFFEPAARALIELRRDLLWNRLNARRSAQLMRAILYNAEDRFTYEQAPVLIRGAVAFIETRLDGDGFTPEARDELAARLWDLALLLEEGELANARERLRRAQDRLDEAMRNGASPDEIAELMDELREATRDYMQMLAEQMPEEGDQSDQRDRGQRESQTITQSQIQELMDQIQQLMEEGRMDEAADLMAQLNALLENLQMQRGEGGEPMPGGEAMEGLGDTLNQQQGLADETFRNLQEQFGENGEPGKDEAQAQEELARRQRDLAEQLREQQLGEMPGEGTEEADQGLDRLEEAQRAMEGAAEALEEGDMQRALERQAEAMDALREGLRNFREAAEADRRERASTEDGQRQADGEGAGRDPLGRQRGEAREGDRFGSVVPGLDPRDRARELMDEIRRRLAERERPEDERDYLDRLIERF